MKVYILVIAVILFAGCGSTVSDKKQNDTFFKEQKINANILISFPDENFQFVYPATWSDDTSRKFGIITRILPPDSLGFNHNIILSKFKSLKEIPNESIPDLRLLYIDSLKENDLPFYQIEYTDGVVNNFEASRIQRLLRYQEWQISVITFLFRAKESIFLLEFTFAFNNQSDLERFGLIADDLINSFKKIDNE